jgi:hypothetical protein
MLIQPKLGCDFIGRVGMVGEDAAPGSDWEGEGRKN